VNVGKYWEIGSNPSQATRVQPEFLPDRKPHNGERCVDYAFLFYTLYFLSYASCDATFIQIPEVFSVAQRDHIPNSTEDFHSFQSGRP
jgi:hypothetical protein